MYRSQAINSVLCNKFLHMHLQLPEIITQWLEGIIYATQACGNHILQTILLIILDFRLGKIILDHNKIHFLVSWDNSNSKNIWII